ncbi:hypothetical protein PLICRDRAFT_592850 [Plicaturopsis crispa FD-325 SS-3]|nr:hypothetical protein PLICRDRAFT_592850 [Plicaturopsis crispa FD-325 SS-3]
MSIPPFDLYFTGRDDPRDGCIIIGEDVQPIYYEFETQSSHAGSRTTVLRNSGEVVAWCDWAPGDNLGLITLGNRQFHMSQLVLPGSTATARMFISADGNRYEWRQWQNDQNSYDLLSGPNTRIGMFQRYHQETPVGPSYAMFKYTFVNESLLLEALISLSLNRWMDWRGL